MGVLSICRFRERRPLAAGTPRAKLVVHMGSGPSASRAAELMRGAMRAERPIVEAAQMPVYQPRAPAGARCSTTVMTLLKNSTSPRLQTVAVSL